VIDTGLNRRDLLKLAGAGAIGSGLAAPDRAVTATPASVTARAAQAPALQLMTWGGATSSETRDTALRTAYPDLPAVEVVVAGDGDFGVANAVRLALASGQDIPDMVQLNRTQVAEFASAGELLDLSEVYTPILEDVYPGALELVQYNGQYVCFPFELKSKLFFYRADLFEEAEIDPAAIPTVTDFIAAGKTLNGKFPNSHIINLGPQPPQYWIGELLSAYPDVRFADDSGAYQLTTNPAFADALTFLKDLKDSGVALPIDDWSSDWQQAWADEAIAGSLISNWMKFFLPTFAPDQTGNWEAALWPQLGPLADQRYGSEAGGSVFIIPQRSENHAAAVDYLTKMFLDKDGALAVYAATGTTPLLKSAREDFLAAAQSAEKPAGMSDADWAAQPANFFGPDYFDVELSSYDYVKVLAYDPSAAEEIPILLDWVIKLLADEVDVPGALAGAQGDMESQIGNPYEV
jgi:ABC-type glycerol-3-phosphate transport system substrate-binding protein